MISNSVRPDVNYFREMYKDRAPYSTRRFYQELGSIGDGDLPPAEGIVAMMATFYGVVLTVPTLRSVFSPIRNQLRPTPTYDALADCYSGSVGLLKRGMDASLSPGSVKGLEEGARIYGRTIARLSHDRLLVAHLIFDGGEGESLDSRLVIHEDLAEGLPVYIQSSAAQSLSGGDYSGRMSEAGDFISDLARGGEVVRVLSNFAISCLLPSTDQFALQSFPFYPPA